MLNRVLDGALGAPTIIETKTNLLSELFPILRQFNLSFRTMPLFNMASAFLTRKSLTRLVDLDFIDNIYIDWPVRIPEIPVGYSNLNFLLQPGVLGLGLLQSQMNLNLDERPNWVTTIESGRFLGVGQAIDDGISGRGVNVAVIDSEGSTRAANHRQFYGKNVARYQVRALVQSDTCGHGGHVATTIGGGLYEAIPNVYVQGLAPNAHMMLVKCLLTPLGSGSTSDCIEGMNIAIDHGADVVNLSLGSTASDPESDAFVQAINKLPPNKIVCAASGNDGATKIGSPAIAGNALAIGALDARKNIKASFSNSGPELAFIMPGVNIFSGVTRSTLCDVEGRGPPSFAMLSGTSMATPHASGMVALAIELMRQHGFEPTVETFREIGRRYGTPRSNEYGYGPLTYQMIRQYVQENLT